MVAFVSVHDVREECRNDDQLAASFGGLDLRGDQSGHYDFEIDHSMEMQRLDAAISDLIRDVALGMNGGQVAIPDDTEDEQPVLLGTQSNTHPSHWMFDVPKPTTPVDMHTFRNTDVYPSFAQVAQSFTTDIRADSATHIPENKTKDAYDMDTMVMALDVVARSKTRNTRRMTPEETAARKQAARVAKRERQSLVTGADPRRADARRERASRRESTPGQKKTYRRRSGSSSDDTTCSSSSTSAERLPKLYINEKTLTCRSESCSPASLPRPTTGAKRSSTSRAEKNAQTSPYPRTRPERKDKKDKNENKLALPKRVDADEDAEEKPWTPVVIADAEFKQMCPPRNVVENSPEMDAIAQQFERASFTDAPAMVNNEIPAPASPSWKAPELVEETPAAADEAIPVHEIYDGVQYNQEYAVDYLVGDFGLDFTPATAYAPEVDRLWKEFPELDDEDMLYPLDPLDAECAPPTELYSFDIATPSESEPEPEPETILEAYHLNLKQRFCPTLLMQYTYNHDDRLEYTGRYEEVSVQLPDFAQVLKHIYEPKRCKAKAKMTSSGVRFQPYARPAPVAACAAY